MIIILLFYLDLSFIRGDIAVMHYGHFGGLSITCNRDELISMESERLGYSQNSDCDPEPLCSVPYTLAKWYCRGMSTCEGMQVSKEILPMITQYTFSSFDGRNSDAKMMEDFLLFSSIHGGKIDGWRTKLMEDQSDQFSPPSLWPSITLGLHQFYPPSIRFSSINLLTHQSFLHQMRKTKSPPSK